MAEEYLDSGFGSSRRDFLPSRPKENCFRWLLACNSASEGQSLSDSGRAEHS